MYTSRLNHTHTHTQMIEPVADRLNIPRHRIYANTVLFNEDGSYKCVRACVRSFVCSFVIAVPVCLPICVIGRPLVLTFQIFFY